jgi:hypothetical protein
MKDIKFLSDEINAKIKKSAADGGVFLKSLKAGDLVTVHTRNSIYSIEVVDGTTVNIEGGRYFPKPTEANINGSTWGGPMIKAGFIGNEMALEISCPEVSHNRITTSFIESIHVKTDKFSYDVKPEELN